MKVYAAMISLEKEQRALGTNQGEYVDLDFARFNSRAVGYLKVRQKMTSAKEWLRVHLPPVLWRVLQSRPKTGVLENDARSRDLGVKLRCL